MILFGTGDETEEAWTVAHSSAARMFGMPHAQSCRPQRKRKHPPNLPLIFPQLHFFSPVLYWVAALQFQVSNDSERTSFQNET